MFYSSLCSPVPDHNTTSENAGTMHKDVMIVDHIESSYTTLDQVDHHQRKIYEGSMNVFNSDRPICVLNFPSIPYV